jgi:hypothetical protein
VEVKLAASMLRARSHRAVRELRRGFGLGGRERKAPTWQSDPSSEGFGPSTGGSERLGDVRREEPRLRPGHGSELPGRWQRPRRREGESPRAAQGEAIRRQDPKRAQGESPGTEAGTSPRVGAHREEAELRPRLLEGEPTACTASRRTLASAEARLDAASERTGTPVSLPKRACPRTAAKLGALLREDPPRAGSAAEREELACDFAPRKTTSPASPAPGARRLAPAVTL